MNDRKTMRTMPVYEALAHDLKRYGVDTAFGLMSEDVALFTATLDAIGIAFHSARHENDAIAMAEGYADASGRLGVAVVGRGPAVANGMHAAVSASRTGSKMLVVYGAAPVDDSDANRSGPDTKAFDAQAILALAGLKSFAPASPAAARAALADAIGYAIGGRAAAFHLPIDVQMSQIKATEDENGLTLHSGEPSPRNASPASIAVVAEMLVKSRHSLILAGLGAHMAGAGPALEELAEKIGALLITSLKGKDMFSGNRANLGLLGSFSTSLGRKWVSEADLVLVFGASLNNFTTSNGSALPKAPVVQVDNVRKNIGRWTPIDIAVTGDARLVAQQIIDAVPARKASDKPFHADQVLNSIAAFDISGDFAAANTARTVDPRSLAVELDRLLPRNRNLIYDGGNFMGAVPYISQPGPANLKWTGSFGSVGLGLGTALGFAVARPDATNVLLIGDGGLAMTLGELDAVARIGVPLKIVLFNDCAYGAELHVLRAHQQPDAQALFPDIDFAGVAANFGLETATVRSLEDLRSNAQLLQDGGIPALLDCKINADIASPFMSELIGQDE
jgi:acetolactate synthase I/II/III large subunit